MNNLGNLIISASAGSGKTFRLTTRFLFMLLHELDPTRTVALTFSRSTAGEFLLSILQRLSKASRDKDTRIELEQLFKADFKDLSQPEVSQDSCMKALRRLTAQLHRLNLWTIDSFFHRILSVFPFEFGLTGGFNILREYEEESIRHQVLVRLLQDATGQDLQKLALNFLSANSGKASGRFFPEFSKFVGNNHPILLEVGDDSRWGNPSMIWNAPCPYTSLDEPDRSRHIKVFKSEISTVEHGTIRNSLNRFISKLEKWNPGGKIDIPKCIQVAWQDISAFRQGNGYCTHGSREFPLSSPLASAIGILLSDILARELDVRLERTSGRLQLLRAYEDLYRKEVRERGLLTFADLPVLLNPTQEGTPFLSHQPGEVERLWMDYRMDANFDHWFFDEFQDTSNLQWNAMSNLASEVAQGNDEGRSLFAVGDPKQAIYAWRGGDHSLFEKIGTRLSLESEPMNQSWRSVPAVLELVNGVFSGIGQIDGFSNDATARWADAWMPHEACKPNQDLPGFSRLYFVDRLESRSFGDLDYQETIFPLMLDLLKRVRPQDGGWDCGILVSRNKHIPMVVDFLRSEGIEVAGDAAVAEGLDNPATSLLYSLVKFMVHPEDSFCRQHLLMSPLREEINQVGDDLLPNFHQQLCAGGFECALNPWLEHLGIPESDTFSRMRVDGFMDLCRVFDESGSRDIDAFLQFVGNHKSRPSGSGGAVRVMTIHRSKGATLDMTIVLGMDGDAIDTLRKDHIHVGRDADRKPAWVMELPPEPLCQGDSVLRTAYTQARNEATYENLCKLYVGLTRARYGLYVISPRPTASANYPKLLEQTLGIDPEKCSPLGSEPDSWESRCRIVWESRGIDGGSVDSDWSRNPDLIGKKGSVDETSSQPAGLQSLDATEAIHPFSQLSILEPSRTKSESRAVVNFLSDYGSDARRFGTEVHAVFEQIEWIDEDLGSYFHDLCKRNPEFIGSLKSGAEKHVRNCLEAKSVRELFDRPSVECEVWREKHFLTILNSGEEGDQYCSGIMDRVVLHQDGQGDFKAAEVIDFKTDRVDEDSIKDTVEKYRPQLEVYQRVLSQLTGLPLDCIRLKLLFTRLNRVVEL